MGRAGAAVWGAEAFTKFIGAPGALTKVIDPSRGGGAVVTGALPGTDTGAGWGLVLGGAGAAVGAAGDCLVPGVVVAGVDSDSNLSRSTSGSRMRALMRE